jgi:hypothetical protein
MSITTTSAITKNRSKPWAPLTSTFVFGIRVYRYDTNHCPILYLGDSNFTGSWGIKSDGTLSWSRHVDIDYAGSSWQSTSAIPVSAWTYCEVEVVISTVGAGSVSFYIDGSLDSTHDSITPVSGADPYPTWIMLGVGEVGYGYCMPGWEFTDIYVDSDTVYGPMEIWWQPANTAGSASNFTPLTGDNEEMVDDDGSDDDTTYNLSTAVGTKDRIAHSFTLPFAPLAIQPLAMARASGDGYARAKVGVYSDGSEVLSEAQGYLQQYIGQAGDFITEDPATSSAWTAAGANAAETVIQHVS